MKDKEETYVPDYFISFTKDLSFKGARIVSSKDVKPGDQFTVTLEIPTSFIPILTFSEAVWVRKADIAKDNKNLKGANEVGIKFLKIEDADIKKLENFIELKKSKVYQINKNLSVKGG